MTRWLWLLPVGGVLALLGLGHWSGRQEPASAGARAARAKTEVSLDRMRVAVVARYAHDASAFTQGLLWHQGRLFESTGQHGQSRLRRSNLDTGEIEMETRLDRDFFGEGLARVERPSGWELIWLTWKAGRAFRFDAAEFTGRGEHLYEGEGWGLTLCHDQLYRSDGTAILWRHDPMTFQVNARLAVTRSGRAVQFLNELECTPRGILANIWQSDEIVQIDPLSGRVTSTIDAGGLLSVEERRRAGVLNGIAYRAETDTLLLTGKHWPWLFEVVLQPE